MKSGLELITGRANPELAHKIGDHLKIPLLKAKIRNFDDGEIQVHIEETVRGKDVFVIQPTCPPVNENLMELLLIIDTLKRASAGRITAVIPYFGYGRQDRKHIGRVPISARLVANLIETAGADRILTMDLHAGQIQGFFSIPVDELYADSLIISYFKKAEAMKPDSVCPPDIGGLKRARTIGQRLGVSMVVVEKRHTPTGTVETLSVIGAVQNKKVLIVDDMISTGGTLLKAAKALIDSGAEAIIAACAHGLFVQNAMERIKQSPIGKVIVTDSIPSSDEDPILDRLSVASLFADAINRIHNNDSLSELFYGGP